MKFNVTVTRDTTESTTVDVEADSAEEAEAKALDEANQDANAFDWVADDCSGGDPYIGDPGNAAEEAEQDCGQCEGTGTTDAMGYSEECPVCDGSGRIAA